MLRLRRGGRRCRVLLFSRSRGRAQRVRCGWFGDGARDHRRRGCQRDRRAAEHDLVRCKGHVDSPSSRPEGHREGRDGARVTCNDRYGVGAMVMCAAPRQGPIRRCFASVVLPGRWDSRIVSRLDQRAIDGARERLESSQRTSREFAEDQGRSDENDKSRGLCPGSSRRAFRTQSVVAFVLGTSGSDVMMRGGCRTRAVMLRRVVATRLTRFRGVFLNRLVLRRS